MDSNNRVNLYDVWYGWLKLIVTIKDLRLKIGSNKVSLLMTGYMF